MLSARRVVLAVMLVGLVAVTDAWAGSTLHIGPGAGTACATGCGGHPNLFSGALKVDIYQTSGGATPAQQPVLLILGVPSQYDYRLPLMPIVGAKSINAYPGGVVALGSVAHAQGGEYGLIPPVSPGYFGDLTAGQEVYSFLGLPGANNSNSFTNWADELWEYLWITADAFSLHVYAISADLGPQGLIDLKLVQQVPKGTFIIAYGQGTDGEPYSVPLTEAGLKVNYGGHN